MNLYYFINISKFCVLFTCYMFFNYFLYFLIIGIFLYQTVIILQNYSYFTKEEGCTNIN